MRRLFPLWAAFSLLLTLYGVPFTMAGSVNYSYDDAGRLVAADYGNGKKIAWTYDKNGNLLKREVTVSTSPVPHIQANLSDGPVTVSSGTPVSITVSLSPGDQAGQTADWWVASYTSLGWETFVYPTNWLPGINVCIQYPLFTVSPPVEVRNTVLPVGDYTFYFAIDNNADGNPDATWWDSVEVHVE
jgi:YD repeat-containing protein